ncbi:MAG TPA: DUF2304 domain-containing protein [Verrucomicrobiae bacterium]|nr:DUF2304 domain-containing protein [Verrucomicrobiae bacterium]
MGIKIKLIAFALGLMFFYVILRNVKRNTFRPSYAVLWLGMAAFLLSIAVFEPLYKWVATSVIGILDARHIIYIALISFLLIYVFFLTSMVTRLSYQVLQLISAIAILETKLNEQTKSQTAGTNVPNPAKGTSP